MEHRLSPYQRKLIFALGADRELPLVGILLEMNKRTWNATLFGARSALKTMAGLGLVAARDVVGAGWQVWTVYELTDAGREVISGPYPEMDMFEHTVGWVRSFLPTILQGKN